jgi:hypothetical protein
MFVDVICGPGLECDGPSARCTVPGAEGEPCTGPSGVCAVGLHCDAADGEEGTCQPRKTEGPCQSSTVCALGFTCLQPDGGEGTCTRIKAVGAPCTLGLRECAGYCSPEGTCQVVAGEGESCGSLPDSTGAGAEYATCGAGLFCDRLSLETSDAVCRPQLPLGATPPATIATGSACEERDTRTFTDPDTRRCATCE